MRKVEIRFRIERGLMVFDGVYENDKHVTIGMSGTSVSWDRLGREAASLVVEIEDDTDPWRLRA